MGGHTTGQYRGMYRRLRRLFRASRTSRGFTIIEVLIVLAVTALIFVAAVVQISGRQNRTAFQVAVREVQSQIQKTINEVSTGFYPNLGDIQCTGSAATGPVITFGTTEQGANSGCIFLGKALQFKVAGTSPEQFATLSIAGVQQGGVGSAESSSLAEAKPLAIASTESTTLPSATVTDTLQSGLTVSKMWYMNGASQVDVGIVAFVGSLAQFSGGALQSGAQQVNMVPIDLSVLDDSLLRGAEALNAHITTSTVNPTSGLFICFVSGTTDESALITIGGNSRQLTVTLATKSNTTCS